MRFNTTVPIILLLLISVSQSYAFDGISVSAGPMISNLAPADSVYENRFLTPGTSAGLAVDIDAPGILSFRITGEYFWKKLWPRL